MGVLDLHFCKRRMDIESLRGSDEVGERERIDEWYLLNLTGDCPCSEAG